jgi:hypothetical protein
VRGLIVLSASDGGPSERYHGPASSTFSSKVGRTDSLALTDVNVDYIFLMRGSSLDARHTLTALADYARIFSTAASKADSFKDIQEATDIVMSILKEVGFHKEYCAKFGTAIDEDELEDMGTVAYTRSVFRSRRRSLEVIQICARRGQLEIPVTHQNRHCPLLPRLR